MHSDYFPKLMQVLRSSISKLLVISTLLVGFGLYLAQPASAKEASKAVDNLLDEVAKNSQNISFQKELSNISSADFDEDELINKLSSLFAQHDLDKDILSDYGMESRHIYRLLLIEWNYLKEADGMAKAPLPEMIKPATAIQVDKFGTSGGGGTLASGSDCSTEIKSISFLFENYFDRSLTPMEDEIAIGAP